MYHDIQRQLLYNTITIRNGIVIFKKNIMMKNYHMSSKKCYMYKMYNIKFMNLVSRFIFDDTIHTFFKIMNNCDRFLLFIAVSGYT